MGREDEIPRPYQRTSPSMLPPANRHCPAPNDAAHSVASGGSAPVDPPSELGETSQGGAPRRRGKSKKTDRGATPKSSRPKHSRLARAFRSTSVLVLALYVALALAVRARAPSLDRADTVSAVVLDRDDRLLRAFTAPDGRWRLPLEPHEVDQRYIAMLVAFEDKRFHAHRGIDPSALTRAAWQLARNGRIVSGGSTLTMQVARLLDGEHQRTGAGKARQMLAALQLEHRLTKTEILRAYLRLAPFGGNVEGVRAASLAYFGKEPRRLSVAEAALLVAIPQAPEARRPDMSARLRHDMSARLRHDRHTEVARRARDRVLARALAAGIIKPDEAADARREPVPTVRREFPKLSPHLAETQVRREPARTVHRTTIDRDAQVRLEPLVAEHARKLGPKLSVALIAIDHRTGEILAHVGSADYFDETRLGAVDMTQAVRSPGSTLKPLVYGLAFEAGLAHPETLIEDRPERFGTYLPKNFDDDFRGTVTIREALADSLNIPAVKVLAAVGPSRLAGRLRRIDAHPVFPARSEPTLAMALGGVGLTLTDLARLYTALARGGEAIPLVHTRDVSPARVQQAREVAPDRRRALLPAARCRLPGASCTPRLLSPVAAWYVADILRDAPPPASARAGRIAYKTGTSYGHRDAWAAGFDGRHAIVVWVGRADATATPGLTGRTAAAPILFDAFARLADRPAPFAFAPAGVIRAASGSLPLPLRRFKSPGDEAEVSGPFLEPPVAIAFPQDRAEVATEAHENPEVVLKAEGGALPLVWLVDGAPIDSDPARRDVVWEPQGRGFSSITVIDARGRTDRVAIRVR